ncbi:bacteriocin biosynthesis cyclodehydratase domain-containing protein [Cryobacterium mesophilum]|uniref:TOMM leader peptide-binding protein n=1 Tax=Terrimesophilobacter mesophilus TaxID=433647 RepID=A0A4R8VDJ4_9MICO|nr:TOMM precursor leader peptide-binding protein [Terrimesophilobacter mesophilus]MBB5633870.1 bacteriocin biosynthesis cyclodehydratase domain-containing protein [Terrimesophilobacter mesophilus]TFB80546.1 TOMM precursor leader peptide-binding protein [Terrimesophilobacter mesophilus]
MALKLDPRYPVVWRSPDSLQLGVDAPRVLLNQVSTAHERMLAALAVGVTRAGLTMIGNECGLDADAIAAFERDIRPALSTHTVPVPTRAPRGIVTIDGRGPTADRLEWRLREAELDSRRPAGSGDADELTDFAVVLGDFVLDPGTRQRWLRRDVPHLPVVFSDKSVTIGPVIEPGDGPCLFCLELHRKDADPAWPAIASQLLGRRSPIESPFLASEAATAVARIVHSRVAGIRADTATSISIDAATGHRVRRTWTRHPECGCAGIPELSEPGQQENETPYSRRDAGRSTQTRRGAVASVPA